MDAPAYPVGTAFASQRNIMTRQPVRLFLLVSCLAGFQAFAQTANWDSSGNGMLNGNYYFRQVIYQLSSAGNGTLSEAYSLYGTVNFNSGAGSYSMNVTLVDLGAGRINTGSLTGTYTIA